MAEMAVLAFDGKSISPKAARTEVMAATAAISIFRRKKM
jgi:hypothetical protein